MKIKTSILSLGLVALLLIAFSPSQAQQFGYNFSGGIFNTNGNGGVNAHLQNGTYGQFGANDRWAAIGQVPFAAVPGIFQYGMRLQAEEYQGLFQMEQETAQDAFVNPRNLIIGFGAVKNSTTQPAPSSLEVRYIQQDQSGLFPTLSTVDIMSVVPATTKNISSTVIGICGFGSVAPCYGRVGIERTNPTYTLDVNGLIRGTNVAISSDARFKKDINTIDNGISVLQNLRGTTYEFRADEDFGEEAEFDFTEGKQAGFIAQEVEEILPHLVYTDEQGFKSVNYMGMLPYLVEGVKTVDNENASLKTQVAELQAQNESLIRRIEALEGNSAADKGAGSSLGLEPAQLFQNVPNPFDKATEIRYFIPEGSSNSQLLVFDMNGRQLRNYDLTNSGEGKVVIEGSDMEAGMYFYSLVADGIEIDTKRMILTK